jgi:hypothetical protein
MTSASVGWRWSTACRDSSGGATGACPGSSAGTTAQADNTTEAAVAGIRHQFMKQYAFDMATKDTRLPLLNQSPPRRQPETGHRPGPALDIATLHPQNLGAAQHL